MVKVMRMGVGALAFAAMDAFGHEAMEYVQDEQARVTKVRLIIFFGGASQEWWWSVVTA